MKLATSVLLKVKLHHSRAADSTISTVDITTVKSMIESPSLRSTSLVASDMKDRRPAFCRSTGGGTCTA